MMKITPILNRQRPSKQESLARLPNTNRRRISHRASVVSFGLFLLLGRGAIAQKPLIDDDRAYSAKTPDRAYIGARCAALYLGFAESMMAADRVGAKRLGDEAKAFSRRVPNPPESVFLEWASAYGERFAREELPEQSLTGKDYNVCSGTLMLIRDGDHIERYTRAELKFLFGG
jgi:hypothetical protein